MMNLYSTSTPTTPTTGITITLPTVTIGSYSTPSTPASSVPSTPTGSVGGGDIHSGSLSWRSFSRMLTDSAHDSVDGSDDSDDEIDLMQLLEGLEPFPFTPATCEELFAQDDRYQQDLQESIDLLLL
ncbi:hypothetical protein PybrP1_001980 [[Pythium] brassicae (nom. inval.)]|nr:hypothetical protein PybrP1_001980 [[Pythium] brassicae (nom. inval.)]